MTTISNGESGLSVRTKINNVLQHADGTASELVINDAGADVNFRVESDTDANALFVDGGTGNVGIGTSSPSQRLEVSGNAKISNYLYGGDGEILAGQDGAAYYLFAGAGAGAAKPVYIGSNASFTAFSTAGGERMRIDASGNVLIGGTTAGTASAGNLVLVNGTAPTGNVTNGITLYAEDVSASSELKVRDEAGNVTTLSPHNFDLIPEGPSEDMAWSYYSERDGKRINVDMLKAIRLLEQISGEKLVHMA